MNHYAAETRNAINELVDTVVSAMKQTIRNIRKNKEPK